MYLLRREHNRLLRCRNLLRPTRHQRLLQLILYSDTHLLKLLLSGLHLIKLRKLARQTAEHTRELTPCARV